jgi:uncharacterized protein (DUF1499 family)
VLLGVGLLAAQGGALRGTQPTDLGVKDGRLKAPSAHPQQRQQPGCAVSGTPAKTYASIEPLPLKNGDAAASLAALSKALQSVPRREVVDQQPDYVYAQAQTRWLKFVDDMEFWANPATGVVELRSASRLGREDFGANRERIEAVRAAYLAQP